MPLSRPHLLHNCQASTFGMWVSAGLLMHLCRHLHKQESTEERDSGVVDRDFMRRCDAIDTNIFCPAFCGSYSLP
jgi:hypothetical protein